MAKEKILDVIKQSKTIDSAYDIKLNKGQGTNSASATRKDYVDSQDALKVNKAGDTMTGNLVTSGGFYADGLISSKIQVIAQNTENTYATRMVVSGSAGYLQAGKTDRDVADQKLILSGWLGTPLTMSKFSMANGVNPQVTWGSTNHDILHRGNMPTVADISAMGRYSRPDGDDCNNAIVPGNYGIGGFTTNTPIGSGPSGSTLLVLAWDNGTTSVSQMFISYTENRVWIRKRYTGVWQPWFELYSSASKQPVGGAGTGVDDNPNAITVTGGVRDFNLVKTNGIFTTDGSWLNGTTNVATGVTHNGILEVKQRSLDNLTIQKFTQITNNYGVSVENVTSRAWNNSTDGWSPWVKDGMWENVSMYRSGILRLNDATNDSVYPYVSYTKEKYRDTVAVGTGYTIGEIGFRVNPTSRYDPHSGDQLGRILGLVFNTATTGEYDGGLFLASRLRRPDGTIADSSTLAINRAVGAEFTHAAKKVNINTGVVTAENFLQSTEQSNLVNSSTRKDYVDGEIAKQVAKTGDTMTGNLRVNASIDTFSIGSTGAIMANTTSTKSGIRLGSDSIGYSEIVPRRANEAGYLWSDSIRYYDSNNYWAIGTNRILHDAYSPRLTSIENSLDLNTISVPVKTMSLAHFGSAATNKPNTSNSANSVVHISTWETGTYAHQLAFSSDGKMYNRYNNNVSWSDWGQVYTSIYRPTPAEVGAVNKTGDTMTGALWVDRGTTVEPTMGVARSGRTLYLADNGTQVGLYSKIGGSFINSYLVSRNINDGNITIGGDTVNLILRGAGNLKHGSADVYTTANKPTAADVGAVSKTGDTMTGALTIAPTSGVNAEVVLNSTTTTESSILFRNGSVTRWKFYQDTSAESGSNVGSDLLLRANADDGSSLGFVFDIQRESQIMSFVRNPRTNATQDTASNSLTRKDYVDGQVAALLARIVALESK